MLKAPVRLLDADKEYFLTLRATAVDTAMSEIRCKLWVGGDGRFHIEQCG
jgi:hypothetical protein